MKFLGPVFANVICLMVLPEVSSYLFDNYDMCSGCSDFTDGYLWQWCIRTHCLRSIETNTINKRFDRGNDEVCSGCSDFTDGYLWQWCVRTHCVSKSRPLHDMKKRFDSGGFAAGNGKCSECSDLTDGSLWQWCVRTHCGAISGLKKRMFMATMPVESSLRRPLLERSKPARTEISDTMVSCISTRCHGLRGYDFSACINYCSVSM